MNKKSRPSHGFTFAEQSAMEGKTGFTLTEPMAMERKAGFTLKSAFSPRLSVGTVLPDMRVQPRKGFTLIELLLAISIMGILIGISIYSFSASQSSARDAQRKTDLKRIAQALERYRALEPQKIYPISSWTAAIDDTKCVANPAWSCSNVPNPDQWIFGLAAQPTPNPSFTPDPAFSPAPYISKLPVDPKQQATGTPCGSGILQEDTGLTTYENSAFTYGYFSPAGHTFLLSAKLEDPEDKDTQVPVTVTDSTGTTTTFSIKGCYLIGSP